MIASKRAAIVLAVVFLGAALVPSAAAGPPDERGKPDKCEKKKPKPECEVLEPPLPYITTIAGGGYSDGKPAIEAPLGFPVDVVTDPAGNVYISRFVRVSDPEGRPRRDHHDRSRQRNHRLSRRRRTGDEGAAGSPQHTRDRSGWVDLPHRQSLPGCSQSRSQRHHHDGRGDRQRWLLR